MRVRVSSLSLRLSAASAMDASFAGFALLARCVPTLAFRRSVGVGAGGVRGKRAGGGQRHPCVSAALRAAVLLLLVGNTSGYLIDWAANTSYYGTSTTFTWIGPVLNDVTLTDTGYDFTLFCALTGGSGSGTVWTSTTNSIPWFNSTNDMITFDLASGTRSTTTKMVCNMSVNVGGLFGAFSLTVSDLDKGTFSGGGKYNWDDMILFNQSTSAVAVNSSNVNTPDGRTAIGTVASIPSCSGVSVRLRAGPAFIFLFCSARKRCSSL